MEINKLRHNYFIFAPDLHQLIGISGNFTGEGVAQVRSISASGIYAESKQIMDQCCLKLNDYNVQLIQADNYYNIGDFLSAIKSYQLAKNMIPCRFIPLDGLLDIYLSQQHNDEAKAIAKEIVSKPIKNARLLLKIL